LQGSRTDKFEVRIPIRRTDVKQYCAAIKEIGQPGEDGITIEALMEHMSSKFGPWREVNQPDSLFMQILMEYHLLGCDTNRKLISKKALLLWGIILCSGDNNTKIQSFYSVLQDNDQKSIAALDNDFPHNFYLIVNFAIALVNIFENRLSKQPPEFPESYIKFLDEYKENLMEDLFLEPVFGAESTLDRPLWEKNTLMQASWILDSDNVRKKVIAYIEEKENKKYAK